MKITDLEIKGVKILEPRVFSDYRGSYSESYSARTLNEYGITTVFIQDNHSKTTKKGTLRGIHYQNNPKPQAKLVRCTRGKILDVVVDFRQDSPTYKQWLAVELSEENNKQIWIPNGFGHAFLTLTDNCEVLYKVDEFYEPTFDRAIAWNDQDISIDWPIKEPILSEKDKKAPLLKDSDCNLTIKVND
ncbi:MAG: dTDP-4-dehydrorhamnose 3,5-epimerase [Firmicutes bacterium]|nr:dTDP-4-dehydrorhamnose 3,5-epimerase [Bacillota bacterium]